MSRDQRKYKEADKQRRAGEREKRRLEEAQRRSEKEIGRALTLARRVGLNPNKDWCDALVNLGVTWDYERRPPYCSFRKQAGSRFCGAHRHLELVAEQVDEARQEILRNGAARGLLLGDD